MTSGKQRENLQELEQDWYPNKPGMQNDARFKRLANNTATRQEKLLQMTEQPNNDTKPNVSSVYVLKNKVWQATGFRCLDCGKVFPTLDAVEKHPLVCNFGFKINKSEETEILQRVKKNANTKNK